MKKKVLFLIFNLEKGGGAERVLIDQINNLDKEIFERSVCILNSSIDADFFQSILIPAENKKVIHFNSFFSISSWLKIILWMRKNNFDIVYSHLFFANLVGRVAGKISGVKRVIVVEHNVYLSRRYFQRLANRILSSFSYKVVAVSESVKNYLIDREGINYNKISVVYNGVNLNKYIFDSENRSVLRNNLKLSEDDFVVLSIGQVTLQKNYDLLVDIAHEVNKVLGEKIYFFIAGGDDGSLGDKLKTRINEFGLRDIVNFLGLRDDIPDLLSGADVFMMTSSWEGFGLALVEGMANGKPVLVNNISTLKEIVGQDGRYGLVARDQKEFANFLVKLKKDKMFYEKYANLALRRSADFSLEENIKQITKLFLES
ncbi:MAG: glycosyltransferase [Candidatus Paceibacterota bacterium]|jgi:glycosyltransferase involved in cell wall biosynthesis